MSSRPLPARSMPNAIRLPARTRHDLLAQVFRGDADACPRCGGPMRWLDVATTQQAATQLLSFRAGVRSTRRPRIRDCR